MQTVEQQELKDCIYTFLTMQKEVVTTQQLMEQDEIGSAVREAIAELVAANLAMTTMPAIILKSTPIVDHNEVKFRE